MDNETKDYNNNIIMVYMNLLYFEDAWYHFFFSSTDIETFSIS